jgi:hypothetical protein
VDLDYGICLQGWMRRLHGTTSSMVLGRRRVGGAGRCRGACGDGERLEGRGRAELHVRSGARLQVLAASS